MSRFAFSRLLVAAAATVLLAAPVALRGYALIGGSWPTGTIPLSLQLDATAPASVPLPLTDGSASWNVVAQTAIGEWNTAVAGMRSRLVGTVATTTAAKMGDGVNNVFFSNRAYDLAFDNQTLAITLVDHTDADGLDTVKTNETDLIVNNNRTWNAYHGPSRSNPLDLHRVILHELGHVLGLDHPDLAVPAQSVTAIMNSSISSLETLQTDDKSGAAYLYTTPLLAATLTQQPTSQTAVVSTPAHFTIAVNGGTPPAPAEGLLSYKWYFKATGATDFEQLFTLDTPNLDLGSVQTLDAGSYYLQIATPDRIVTSNTVTLTVTPATTTPATALANLSTRGIVPVAGDTTRSPMIVGFVVTGTSNKNVLVRAVGPALASYGVTGTLADPQLALKNASGTTIATSPATWDAANGVALRNAMASVGAFPLPAGSKDAVLMTSLAPGNYTAVASSPSSSSGVVLIEAYDLDPLPNPASRLANLATRGYTGTGANLLIAGFKVTGPGPHTYLIRLAGDTLGSFGVSNTLFDPYLKLYDNTTGALLREADDWDSPASAQPALQAAFTQVGAFPFKDRKESAMLVTLQPGLYTAQASGNDNAGTSSPTGNTLIEIYEVP